MKNIFFRTTSLWASVLYMALGLVLTFWPGMSGTVFCWGIAAALILYAAHSFWYFIKARNLGFTAGGTLVIGILCLAFGYFLLFPPVRRPLFPAHRARHHAACRRHRKNAARR